MIDNATKKFYDDADEKVTHPELQLKLNIIQAEDSLLLSERTMMDNFRLYGRIMREDRIRFCGNIVLLWSFIMHMTLDKGVDDRNKHYLDILSRLKYGFDDYSIRYLIDTEIFILDCLHKLNLANLFVKGQQSFKEALDNEY